MRHFPLSILTAAVLAGTFPVGAAAADTVVRVVVTNVKKTAGMLLAGAYVSPETWLGATTVATREVSVAGNVRQGTVAFDMPLPPGTYALSVFQDMNGNRKLDTNLIGIPTEASGSSNDAPARWSAPKFQDAVFTVGDQPIELTIKLN
ncbi:MAG: DUF2141 domain-containing protein [Gammaproteobacteria bacterium]